MCEKETHVKTNQGRASHLVVEEDAVGGVHVVGLAVVHHDPVRVLLGYSVRRARIERRLLCLGNLAHLAIQLRGGCLVEASEVRQAAGADRVQQPERSDAIHFSGVLRHFERHLIMVSLTISLH